MKKRFFTLLFLAGMFIGVNAQSGLVISMVNNAAFTVFFDNTNFSTPMAEHQFHNITPGYHQVKIFRSAGPFGNQNIPVFTGYINILPNAVTYARLDQFNKIQIANVDPQYVYQPVPNARTNYRPQNTPRRNTWQPNVMSNEAFATLKQMINKNAFDSNKKTIAMQALDGAGVTCAQLTELLGLFSFESYKVDVAKYAYDKVVDKQNFFMVNNAFTFSSSINELNKYIASR